MHASIDFKSRAHPSYLYTVHLLYTYIYLAVHTMYLVLPPFGYLIRCMHFYLGTISVMPRRSCNTGDDGA